LKLGDDINKCGFVVQIKTKLESHEFFLIVKALTAENDREG